jgi:hypothetical protein
LSDGYHHLSDDCHHLSDDCHHLSDDCHHLSDDYCLRFVPSFYFSDDGTMVSYTMGFHNTLLPLFLHHGGNDVPHYCR